MLYPVEDIFHFVKDTYGDNTDLDNDSSMECVLELDEHLAQCINCGICRRNCILSCSFDYERESNYQIISFDGSQVSLNPSVFAYSEMK